MKEREGTSLESLLKSNISGEKLRVAIRAFSYLVLFLGNNQGTSLALLLKSNISEEKLRVAIRAFSYLVVFPRK